MINSGTNSSGTNSSGTNSWGTICCCRNVVVTARYKEYEVEQDTPNCTMVIERRCGGVVGNTCFTIIPSSFQSVHSSELGLPHPLSCKWVCLPSQESEGEGHRRVRRWGSRNSDDWRKSLALCQLCAFNYGGHCILFQMIDIFNLLAIWLSILQTALNSVSRVSIQLALK